MIKMTPQVPMPTDRVDDASTVTAVTGEALTWFYLSSGAWASATGQAAGTIVTGKLAFTGILNSIKSAVGHFGDSSFSLAAATRLSIPVLIPEDVLSDLQFLSPTDQITKITPHLPHKGMYCVDHRRGQVWAKSKDTVANDSASYSYAAPVAGSGGPTSNVNLNQVGGTAVTLGQKTSANSIPVVLPSDAPASTGSTSSGDNTYLSPADFTATYASGTTLTLTGIPFTPTNAQFASVKKVTAGAAAVTYTPDVNIMSYNSSTGVLTVTGATFAAGDTFVVTIMAGPPKRTDTANDAMKNMPLRDESDNFTGVQTLLSAAQNLTDTAADVGGELYVRRAKWVRYFVTVDINDSNNVRFKFLAKHTSAGAEEYVIDPAQILAANCGLSTGSALFNIPAAAADDTCIEVSQDADALYCIRVPVDNSFDYLQLQTYAGTVGGTAGQIDALYADMGY